MKILTRLLLLASALVALAHTGFAQDQAKSPAMEKVRVGGIKALTFLPIYVAAEQGFFARHGLDVELITMGNLAPALLSGEIDVSLSGSDFAIMSAFRGKPTPAIVTLQQRNSMSLTISSALPRPNADKGYPQRLKDLQGKTIAIPSRGTASEVFVKQVMGEANMEEGKDYSIIVIGSPGALITALNAKQVDAVNLWSPFQEQVWLEKTGVSVARMHEEGARRNAVGLSVLANSDFLKARPAVVKKFVDAVMEAEVYTADLAKNEASLVDIAMKHTGVTNRDAVALALKTISALAYPGIDCATWTKSAESLLEMGTIQRLPKCDEMIASGFAPSAPLGPK